MRSSTPRDLEGHCAACWLRREVCVCPFVPRIQNRTEIVIVRHVAEERLTSNTARLAQLALGNCRLLPYGGGAPFEEAALVGAGTYLLYPGVRTQPALLEVRRLVVLDGTFNQARRMYKRIPALRSMPELALPAPANPPLRLRRPTHRDGMSTLEAIAAALGLVEDAAQATALQRLFEEFVRRSDAVRGRQR